MSTFKEDLEKFMRMYGVTNEKPHISYKSFPLYRHNVLKRAKKLFGEDFRWQNCVHIDHPRTWMNGRRIACHTVSIYDMSPLSDEMQTISQNIDYLTNGKYKAEAYRADEVNCYFDKDKSFVHPDEVSDDFYKRQLHNHCTLILIPNKEI